VLVTVTLFGNDVQVRISSWGWVLVQYDMHTHPKHYSKMSTEMRVMDLHTVVGSGDLNQKSSPLHPLESTITPASPAVSWVGGLHPCNLRGSCNLHFCILKKDTGSDASATGLMSKMLPRLFPLPQWRCKPNQFTWESWRIHGQWEKPT
jgi:hypothetical protein